MNKGVVVNIFQKSTKNRIIAANDTNDDHENNGCDQTFAKVCFLTQVLFDFFQFFYIYTSVAFLIVDSQMVG